MWHMYLGSMGGFFNCCGLNGFVGVNIACIHRSRCSAWGRSRRKPSWYIQWRQFWSSTNSGPLGMTTGKEQHTSTIYKLLRSNKTEREFASRCSESQILWFQRDFKLSGLTQGTLRMALSIKAAVTLLDLFWHKLWEDMWDMWLIDHIHPMTIDIYNILIGLLIIFI